MDRYDYHKGDNDYIQAGSLYRLLPTVENERLRNAITSARSGVLKEIIKWQLGYFVKADKAYAAGLVVLQDC